MKKSILTRISFLLSALVLTALLLPEAPIMAALGTQLAFTTQPAGAMSGLAMTTQPVVAVQDATGATDNTSGASVTISITPSTGTAGAVLSGNTTVNAVNGVATFTNLTIDMVGDNYTLRATSGNLTLATSTAFNVTLPSPPADPTNLYGVVVNSGRVDLYWTDSSNNEAGFDIERAPDVGGLGAGPYSPIGVSPTVPANTTTYTDATVAASTAYWYRVFAVNAGGSSFPSNEIRVVTSLTGPQISLLQPSSSAFTSGSSVTILTSAAAPGSSVASADYQLVMDNPPGVFNAKDIYAVQMNLAIPPPTGASSNDTTPMPANLPGGCIAEFEIRGTVSAISGGAWTIGSVVAGHPEYTQPLTVYESASTRFVGYRKPAPGDSAKVIAYRNTTSPGPLVAKEIRFIRPGQPAGAPSLILSFLINGSLTNIQPAVTAPGFLISGETWTVGTGKFRIDDPDFPAYIDAAVRIGTPVTVRFALRPAEANNARQIFNQISAAIIKSTMTTPIFDNTPIPQNYPPGTWLYMIVDGVVMDKNLVTGEWTVGTEGIKVYQTANTLVGLGTVGDEVLFWGHRTLAPGPIVLDQLNLILPGPLAQPYKPTAVETHLMYNGQVQTMGPNTWTVGGQTFAVDDPEGPARIDPLPFAAFSAGQSVSVEFDHVGETLPDNANWAPLSLDTATNQWTAPVALPGVSANQTGTLFLRVTSVQQTGSTSKYNATLAAAVAGPPSALTYAASGIAATSATLNGNLASMGTAASASVAFQWGTTSGSLLNTTSAQTVTAPGPFSATVSGLSPGTTYYFRSTATTTAGTVFGTQMSFTTAGSPPPTTTAPPPPAFTGGGGGGAPATTTVSLSGLTGSLTLNSSGAVQTTATITGSGVTLSIPAGTIMKTSAGSFLSTFTMSDATNVPAPPSGKIIVLAKDFGPSGATFDPPIGLTLNYNQAAIPSGVQESGFVIAYWDGTQWVTLSTSVNADANTVSASISHLTIFAVLGTLPTPTPAAPAKFAMTRLAVNPVECKPADTVTVSATVANAGGAEGQYDLVFLINGAKQESKTVTLSSGSSTDVTFTTKAGSGPRIYVVDVNGMQGTFVVQAPETTPTAPSTTTAAAPPAQPSSTNPWIVGGLIAIGAVVVIMLIVLMAGRRKK